MKYKHVIIFDRNECVANINNTNEEIEALLLDSAVVSMVEGEEQIVGMIEAVLYSEFEDRFYGDVWINDKYAKTEIKVKHQDVIYDSGNAGGVVATGFVTYVE